MALTCGEDLNDLFLKHMDDPSDDIKVGLYIKKPEKYRKRGRVELLDMPGLGVFVLFISAVKQTEKGKKNN